MFRATVTPAWDLDAWRAQARHAWQAGLPPDVVEWQADAQRELLASAAVTAVSRRFAHSWSSRNSIPAAQTNNITAHQAMPFSAVMTSAVKTVW